MNVFRVRKDPGPSGLLNIGCGSHYHSEWRNLDLYSNDPNVVQHDVRRGIPFDEQQFDAVYHSHILEHLPPYMGRQLIAECFRVLKPGGVLRIVVPDLERIAKLYLTNLERAVAEEPGAAADYHWMKLELLDQMVRNRSGGLMGQYMTSPALENAEFVRTRLGGEFIDYQQIDTSNDEMQISQKPGFWSRIRKLSRKVREKIVRETIRLLLGRPTVDAYREGLFRQRGEVHQWMYDRFSLEKLCREIGFEDFRVCRADESNIPGYNQYGLDVVNGNVRKPDSLFVECIKPNVQRMAA